MILIAYTKQYKTIFIFIIKMENEKMYIVFRQSECDDNYYRPYTEFMGLYKSKEKAIARAKNVRKRTKKYSNPDDCYYVEEHTFDDDVKFKEYSSSESSEEEKNDDISTEPGITNEKCKEEIKKQKKEMKKYEYRGEDEETYFNENDNQYKRGGMVYVIGRKNPN
jgi:hypothetical protein